MGVNYDDGSDNGFWVNVIRVLFLVGLWWTKADGGGTVMILFLVGRRWSDMFMVVVGWWMEDSVSYEGNKTMLEICVVDGRCVRWWVQLHYLHNWSL